MPQVSAMMFLFQSNWTPQWVVHAWDLAPIFRYCLEVQLRLPLIDSHHIFVLLVQPDVYISPDCTSAC